MPAHSESAFRGVLAIADTLWTKWPDLNGVSRIPRRTEMAKKLRAPQGPPHGPPINSLLQAGWKWCAKCQGLWYWDTVVGPCPAGGGHTDEGSAQYGLALNDPTNPGQHRWSWCSNCQGLWFSGNSSLGICPYGGIPPAGPPHVHVSSGSGDYALAQGAAAAGQHGWRWCIQCQGLWYAENNSHGVCPAGGGHVSSGSASYAIKMV